MEIKELVRQGKREVSDIRFSEHGGGSFSLLSEEKLKQEMEELAEPYLERFRIRGTLKTDHPLYYELYPRKEHTGTVVISYGFTESALKYHELIYYFHRHGYQVAVMDHRGHGKSYREVEDPSLVHVEAFRQYVDDLRCFVTGPVRKLLGTDGAERMLLYGHSMGGCIAARYIELYPGDFEKVILNAPMLGVNLGNHLPWAAALLCDVNILLGRGGRRLFYQHGFQPDEPFSKSSASSEARFRYYHELRRQDVSCQTYSASYRWAREAIRAGWLARSRREAAKVTARVLLFQAGSDTLVTPGSHRTFLSRITDGRLVVAPGVRHEIYRAENEVLAPYLQEIFTFWDQ